MFGPSRGAGQIEWDKDWARKFMVRHNISVPQHRPFKRGQEEEAISYALTLLKDNEIVFFKASGLYAGKGVIPAKDQESARSATEQIREMDIAGETFLVEQGLVGEEFSYSTIVDGKNFRCFKSSQDNKRIWNRDQGPNTGGMGCNAPALVTKGLESRIESEIIAPAVKGLNEERRPYKGILYLGGMVCEDGSLKVIEFNSRWGDPEVLVVLPGMKGSYLELVNSAVDGKLDTAALEEDTVTRVTIIGASAGYPGSYEKGKKMWINYDGMPEGTELRSAGIKVKDGQMYTNGGRVVDVTAEGSDVRDAREKALQAMACISIEDNGLTYRTDIAWRDIQRLQTEN